MFVTAVCFLFLVKLKWPNNKNIYDVTPHEVYIFFLSRNNAVLAQGIPKVNIYRDFQS